MNVETTIFNFIDNLNRINGRKNIFFGQSCEVSFLLGDYVVSFLINYKEELCNYLAVLNDQCFEEFLWRVIKYSRDKTVETLVGLNQYIQCDRGLTHNLNCLYEEFIRSIFTSLKFSGKTNIPWLVALVVKHQTRLREVLSSVDELGIFPADKLLVDPIPCSEYSAALQLDILGVSVEELVEPVLDFGCGEHAYLVIHLRNLGIEAFGIDRNVKITSCTEKNSWFDVALKPQFWGTVISHLSFTNHFMRQHLKFNGQHINYIKKYMEILASLQEGGSFFYTPDLPFVEQFLSPSKYTVRKIPVVSKQSYSSEVKTNLIFSKVQAVQIKKT